ncbi:hypothetical protein JCM10207_008932 [Rhodosporidiobolus poonsookiae]
MLPLCDYRDLLDLSPPSSTPAVDLPKPSELVALQTSVLAHLLRELPYSPRRPTTEQLQQYPFSHRDTLLQNLLTIRDPKELPPLPADVLHDLERLTLFRNARNPDPVVPVSSIPTIAASLYPSAPVTEVPPVFHRVKFHQGDFTRLSSPSTAVVNPANTRLLGCFQPSHKCADNVLHAAAGPRLRADCARVMQARGWEDVETAQDVVVTRAGGLEVGYVLHVAGPQLSRRGDRPTPEQEEQLETVYRRCLDLAEEVGTISTVAFPCISTGIFAFPGNLAARIALRTVSAWLDEHPAASSNVREGVFVLFSDSDVQHYRSALEVLHTSLPPPALLPKRLDLPDKVQQWVRDADSVIIHAGAGCSADAVNEEVGLGLDYTSESVFAKLYPDLPLVKWAFILAHGYRVLTWAQPSPPPVYASLLRYAQSRPSGFTVLTSNADQLFPSSGFPSSRLFTPQGNYATFQCLAPACAHSEEGSTFPSFPYCERAVLGGQISPTSMRIPEDKVDELLPRCPLCGRWEDVFFNVRGGEWFDERPTHAQGQAQRYEAQVKELVRKAEERGGHVVVLELGAGFNTPSVVRWPSEELVERYGADGRVKLVRVNLKASEIGVEVEYPGLEEGEEEQRDVAGVKMGAAAFLKAVGL